MPPVNPKVTKDVEGMNHIVIETGKEYDYNVKTTVANKLEGYKSLTIKDILDSRLTVVGAKVLVDGKETNFKVNIDNQEVTVKLTREQLETIKGKEINLVITSKINKGVAIENIENKATIQLNNRDLVESNTVTVIPPKPEEPVT